MRILTDDEAKDATWFHGIEIEGQFFKPSRYNGKVPPNYTLFGFFDLVSKLDITGSRCLDIGTMDGIAAFIMKKRGASEVVATNIGKRPTFEYARYKLGLDVSYVTDTDLYNINENVSGPFDLVLMAGILYHVFDPLYAVTVARQLTANCGYAIIETHFLKDEKEPVMRFNPGDQNAIDQANFFWRASSPCLEAMFRLCSFEVVARRPVGARVTYLLKAMKPSEMRHLNAITDKIHRKFMRYKHYRENIDFNALESGEATSAVKLISEIDSEMVIDVKKYIPSVPLQPKWPTT